MKRFDLQLFADGENQSQSIRTYIPQFHQILEAIYAVKALFSDFFTDLQLLDGVSHKDIAFTVKTNDVEAAVVDGSLESGGTPAYDTGADVAFGTGTSNTNRFGRRTEVRYADTDIPYTWDWTYHEGIDKHTVNEDFDAAHATEMAKIAAKITSLFNKHQSKTLADAAGKQIKIDITADGELVTPADVTKAFAQAAGYLTDIGVDESITRVAAVCPAVYNAIIDSGLATTAKGSTVNIDRNEVTMFKGFVVREIPTGAFVSAAASGDDPATQDLALFGVARIGVPFTGIETARAFEAHDFDGTVLQGAGKAGEYIPADNKKAIVRLTGEVTGA